MDALEDELHPQVASDDDEINHEESDIDSGADSGASDQAQSHHGRRRRATVYDAVAGKVSYRALRDQDTAAHNSRIDTPGMAKHRITSTPFAPDEVLFRRKDAPQRYAEHDIYHSHERDLPRGGQGILPESDMLQAIHSFASRFYTALEKRQPEPDGTNVDFHSMDETALLAFGILMEEASRDVLGKRGDLVFTEGENDTRSHGGDEDTLSYRHPIGHQEATSRNRPDRVRKKRKMTEQPTPDV